MSLARQMAPAVLPTLRRSVRPRKPSADDVAATVARAEPPKAKRGVVVRAITQNAYGAPMPFVVEARAWPPRARLTMGAFVVQHPQATFLVDAGLNSDPNRFLRHMPAVKRAITRGKPPTIGLADALAGLGVRPDFAVLTHLHWDHCCGLSELPGVPARLSAVEAAFGADTRTAREHQVIPETFDDTVFEPFELDGPPVETFPASHDLFGDGSVQIVSIPGHTPGHVGVLLTLRSKRRILLAGDTVWHTDQIRFRRARVPLLGCFCDTDEDENYRSVLRLNMLPRDITVLPAHDLDAIEGTFTGSGPLG